MDMRLHRFYSPSRIQDDSVDIADRELVHQWKHVFRYNVGSQVILFDGSGAEYLCMISSLRTAGATLSVLKKHIKKSLVGRPIWLCMAVVKKDNFEWVVEKATELGITHIVPIVAERTEKKNLNMDRLKKIAVEASEQCGRVDVPTIHPVTTLPELFARNILPDAKILLHPDGVPVAQYFENHRLSDVAVFIGPEGGWSDLELNFFAHYGVPALSMGHYVLRAETAAIAGVSLLSL